MDDERADHLRSPCLLYRGRSIGRRPAFILNSYLLSLVSLMTTTKIPNSCRCRSRIVTTFPISSGDNASVVSWAAASSSRPLRRHRLQRPTMYAACRASGAGVFSVSHSPDLSSTEWLTISLRPGCPLADAWNKERSREKGACLGLGQRLFRQS